MKVYNIGSAWLTQRAGVEHAMELRHDALKTSGYDSKILLTSDKVETFDDDVITLFEYYQGEPDFFSVAEFYKLDGDHTILSHGMTHTIVDGLGNKVRTIHESAHAFEVVHYLGGVEIFDRYTLRGYHSRQVGHISHYFDKDGRTRIVVNNATNIIQLYEGNKVIRLNFSDFVTKAINEIVTDADVLIFDRLDLIESVPNRITTRARQFLVVHNNHIASNHVKEERQTNSFYSYFLHQPNKIEAFITSTHEQARDIADRFGLPTTCIPVGYVLPEVLEVSKKVTNRDKYSAVMFSRIAMDKQIHKVVRSFRKVVNKYPQAKLDVFGFANREADGTELAKDVLINTIEKLGLSDNVHVFDYVKSKEQILDISRHASLYLLASTAEGFNIGLLEGLSAGCVGVSTDVKYGPIEQIENNKTGYVVPYNNFAALADSIIHLFDHTAKLEEMRTASLDHIGQEYTLEKIAQLWADLIEGDE